MISKSRRKQFEELVSDLVKLYPKHSEALNNFSRHVLSLIPVLDGEKSKSWNHDVCDYLVETIVGNSSLSRTEKRNILNNGSILLPGEIPRFKDLVERINYEASSKPKYSEQALTETLEELAENQQHETLKQEIRCILSLVKTIFESGWLRHASLSRHSWAVDCGSIIQMFSEAFFGEIKNPSGVKNGQEIFYSLHGLGRHPLYYIIKCKAQSLSVEDDKERDASLSGKDEKYKKQSREKSKKYSTARKERWGKICNIYGGIAGVTDLTDSELTSKLKALNDEMESLENSEEYQDWDFQRIQGEEYKGILNLVKTTLNTIKPKRTPQDQDANPKAELVADIPFEQLKKVVEEYRRTKEWTEFFQSGENIQERSTKELQANIGELIELANEQGVAFLLTRKNSKIAILRKYEDDTPFDVDRVVASQVLSKNRSLLDSVNNGETYWISRYGKVQAVLCPPPLEANTVEDLTEEQKAKLDILKNISVEEFRRAVDLITGRLSIQDLLQNHKRD